MKNNKELEKLLIEWFDNNDLIKPHFWNRNKIGKLIKDKLNLIGKWRNRMRGNAAAGRKKMLENKEKNKILDW